MSASTTGSPPSRRDARSPSSEDAPRLLGEEEVVGEVLGLVYADRDTGFGVVEVSADGSAEGSVRAAGPLADLVEGQVIRLVGEYRKHPVYGETFEATFYEQEMPTSVTGLRNFLLSERFELTLSEVERVLRVFGDQAGWVIERDPDRLVREAGIEQATAEAARDAWIRGRAFAELVRLLEPAGIPTRVARAVFVRLGVGAASLLREDPYRLLEADGARFAHADAVGEQLGVDPLDRRRLTAGARAAHAAARRQDGHLYLSRDQCVSSAAALLRVDPVAAGAGLEHALEDGLLTLDTVTTGEIELAAVYHPAGLQAESLLASSVVRLLAAGPRLGSLVDAAPLEGLTDGQAEAVRTAFASPLVVITGGPGTGKTHAIETIATAAGDAGMNVALCAPTGRAAKRIEELTGHAATTVHRLLEARPREEGGFAFRYGKDGDRLPHDLVICDEVSMCDTSLASSLISAVDDGTHLVLVGDPDQLPPVGPGDMLRDLLRVQAVPSVRLTEVHRQAAASRIVALARALNDGDVGTLQAVDGDLFMAEERVSDRIVARVVQAVADRIPDYFDVDVSDVQVIAPIYRGPAGVNALNTALKAALNPAAGPVVAGFETGDRVMQTRNDPELDVSNGDVGHVVDVDPGRKELRIRFPRGEVVYDAAAARDLTPAWAMTVHKSQGGEWPVVVFVCDRSHRAMLWRNLAYTAVTRASRGLIIVGQADALKAAARHDRPRRRQTLLAARIEAGVRLCTR